MELDKQETTRLMEEMLAAHQQGGLSRSDAMKKCDLTYQENLLHFKPSRLPQQINGEKLAQNNRSATTIQTGFRGHQAKQTVNRLRAEKNQAEIINSLMSRCAVLESRGQSQDSRLGAIGRRLAAKQAENNNCTATTIQTGFCGHQAKQTVNRLRAAKEAPLMLTNYPHNRPFGPERPLRITDFSHNTVFHPEYLLNRIINLPLQGLQALNAFLAQQAETPNSIVGPRALDISNSNSLVRSRPFSTDNINSVSAASVLGRTYDFDFDAVQDGPNQALASGNRETPLMVTDSALNDKIVTKDSQPRSLGQKLGAAVMLSSAVAAATYIKNPEAAQLAVRQAGVALTTVAQRAIPVIGAAWQSLAQGARVRWGQLVPLVRPLIGAALESGQATLSRVAQRAMPVIGSGFRQARSGFTTLGNQGIVLIGSGLQASSEWIKNHTKK
jgi:hypothetical protein